MRYITITAFQMSPGKSIKNDCNNLFFHPKIFHWSSKSN